MSFPILSASYLGQIEAEQPKRQVDTVARQKPVPTTRRPRKERKSRSRCDSSTSKATVVTACGNDGIPYGRTPTDGVEPSLSPMPVKTHTWISLWFILTTPVIFWDVGYCFMRPRSMEGGDLHWIWAPYSIYQNVDLVYGIPALERGDGFTNAQSFLNVIETLLNVLYVYTAHISEWPPAPLIGLVAASMTLSKTVLYWMQEYYCNYCAVGHNSWDVLIKYWIIPNGLWLVVPSLIIARLGKDLAESLHFAHKASVKSASGKSG